VNEVHQDTEDCDHYYADLDRYRPFPRPVGFYEGPDGKTWESAGVMRNSVRVFGTDLFDALVAAAGLDMGWQDDFQPPFALHVSRVQASLKKLHPGTGKPIAPSTLRKMQRVVECYERPSSVTNWVKATRGHSCQLCGAPGFRKRDGSWYCEVHHLFHLSRNPPPPDCLMPEFVAVVCATCHRRLHYADVAEPQKTDDGWSVKVDGQTYDICVLVPSASEAVGVPDPNVSAPTAGAEGKA